MNNLQKKNRRIALGVAFTVLAMGGLAFASVPLYNLFCRVTGYGGTTQVSQSLPDTVIDRTITVKFNADTERNMMWQFRPEQREIVTKPGQKALASYYAENYSAKPVTGTALYNVTPLKAGKYFHKIECFCFAEQVLNPGQQVSMPVMFYIDPAIADDPRMNDVTTITLSYTFFQIDSPELDKAMEDFYNQEASAPDSTQSGEPEDKEDHS